MLTYRSVSLTYSYIQGYAKYLIIAWKLSYRFFLCLFINYLNKIDYETINENEDFWLRIRFLKYPLVVKPNNGGSSIGLFIAENKIVNGIL
mgnify:CR=1 FL=1